MLICDWIINVFKNNETVTNETELRTAYWRIFPPDFQIFVPQNNFLNKLMFYGFLQFAIFNTLLLNTS